MFGLNDNIILPDFNMLGFITKTEIIDTIVNN